MNRHRTWLEACGWTLFGALCAFTVLSIASIGLFVLPVAGALGLLLGRISEPHAPGMLIGAGLVLLVVGLADNLDGVPTCTDAGVSVPPAPGQPSECESGGVPSLAFILPGLAAIAGGVVTAFRAR